MLAELFNSIYVPVMFALKMYDAGQSEITLTSVFKIAKLNGSSIVFIDEVETLLMSRNDAHWQDKDGDGTVQLFLDLITGHPEVFFMGTTNTPWRIDEAVIRRFIPTYIRMPTCDDRWKLLKDHFILNSLLRLPNTASLDDIGNFIDEMSNFDRIVAGNSEYFKLNPEVEGYEQTSSANYS